MTTVRIIWSIHQYSDDFQYLIKVFETTKMFWDLHYSKNDLHVLWDLTFLFFVVHLTSSDQNLTWRKKAQEVGARRRKTKWKYATQVENIVKSNRVLRITEHTYCEISAIFGETDGVSHFVSSERRYDALLRRLVFFFKWRSHYALIQFNMILLDDTAQTSCVLLDDFIAGRLRQHLIS